MSATVGADALHDRLRQHGDGHAEPLRVRLHRAISWLRRAEREGDDPDARFIFLWIAFNAAYAREFEADESERNRLRQFLATLVSVDPQQRLRQLVFERYSGPIRTMLENRYVFQPFWTALREHDGSGRWEETFAASRRAAMTAVLDGHTTTVLSIVFDRLYVLRNQLVHGGATWNSGVNRAQVGDGARILWSIVPVVIELMLEHSELDFGDILYPVL